MAALVARRRCNELLLLLRRRRKAVHAPRPKKRGQRRMAWERLVSEADLLVPPLLTPLLLLLRTTTTTMTAGLWRCHASRLGRSFSRVLKPPAVAVATTTTLLRLSGSESQPNRPLRTQARLRLDDRDCFCEPVRACSAPLPVERLSACLLLLLAAPRLP